MIADRTEIRRMPPATVAAHAFIWASQWDLSQAARAIAGAANAGFNAIVLPTREPLTFDVDSVARLLGEYRMSPINGIALAPEHDIGSPDPDVAARGEQRLLDAVAVARDIGSGMLTGLTHSPLARPVSPCGDDERERVAEVLARVAARAAHSDIRLGLEAVNRYESSRINTAKQALDMVARIGADNVFIHLDTYHMNIEENDPALAIERCAGHLGYFELSESHRGALGTGTVDFDAVLEALTRAGYTGPVGFEAFSPQVLSPPLAAGQAVWRALWSEPDVIAADARTFIDEHLVAASCEENGR